MHETMAAPTLTPFSGLREIADRKKGTKPVEECKSEEIVKEPPKKRQRKPKAVEAEEFEQRDEQDKELITMLSTYGSNAVLGPYLSSCKLHLDVASLRKKSKQKLESLLEDVEHALATKTNSGVIDKVIQEGMRSIEAVVENQSQMLVVGTTDACFSNEHWIFLLERCKVKHGLGKLNMDPALELTLATATAASIVHTKRTIETPKTDLSAPYIFSQTES
jgi:hypothetical protein